MKHVLSASPFDSPCCSPIEGTHVQVQHLTVSSVSADGCRHNDKLVLCDKVADAAFLARRLCSGMRLDVEFEGEAEGQQCQQEQSHQETCSRFHLVVLVVSLASPGFVVLKKCLCWA